MSAQEHYRAGHGLYGQSRYADAIAEYTKALAIEPDWSDCLQALGMAQMHAGDLDGALASLTRATELTPEDPFAFTSLSMVYVRRNQIEDAERAQEMARMLTWKAEHGDEPGASAP